HCNVVSIGHTAGVGQGEGISDILARQRLLRHTARHIEDSATAKIGRLNPIAPVDVGVAVNNAVFTQVPEGRSVGVNGHAGVVTPAVGIGIVSYLAILRHLFRRVGAGLQRPSNENARPGGAAGAGVTDHGITTVIGGDVGEVAILRVGGEDVGLQHGPVFQVNLCPLDTVDGAATRVTGDGHDRPGRTVAI